MILKTETVLKEKFIAHLYYFLSIDEINKLLTQIVIYNNPVKKYFVFINPETSEHIDDMGEFFFKGGVKIGTYNKNSFPRLNSNGFQYIGNTISKNFINFSNENDFVNFIKNGTDGQSVIDLNFEPQIAVKFRNITIGWGYCKNGHLQHSFPKSVLKIYKEKD